MTKEQAIQLVSEEHDRAVAKHKLGFLSTRDGHSIIEEEYIEFRNEVFADNRVLARKEVTQLAAMCLRYLMDEEGLPR